MRIPRFSALVTTLVLLAAGATSERQTVDDPWAYVTNSDFVLMNGSTEIYRESSYFDFSGSHDTVVSWSHDGKHVAFLSQELPQHTATGVMVLGSDGTMAQRYACEGCRTLVPWVDEGFMAAANDRLFEINPAYDNTVMWAELSDIGDASPYGSRKQHLLGSTYESLILARSDGFTIEVIETPIDGTEAHSRYTARSNHAYSFSEASRPGVGSQKYAVKVRLDPGTCYGRDPVVITASRSEDPSVVGTNYLYDSGSEFGESTGYSVLDLWFTDDAALHALIETMMCDNEAENADFPFPKTEPRVARLNDGEWEWLATGSYAGAQQVRDTGAAQAILYDRQCPETVWGDLTADVCAGGALYLESGGNKTLLEENVLRIYQPTPKFTDHASLRVITKHLRPELTEVPFDQPIVASGGIPPYVWSAAGLPKGVSIDSTTGHLFGISSADGQHKITVSLSDAAGNSVSADLTLRINRSEHDTALHVSAGDGHTCALVTDGSVRCWGGNHKGQLGNHDVSQSHTPIEVVSLPGEAVTIASGSSHTCAILSNGDVTCWGDNDHGQLGAAEFHPVKLGEPATAISAGFQSTCAVGKSGAVYCWGNHTRGAAGAPGDSIVSVPTQVRSLSETARDVVTASFTTCAVTSSGTLFCWGEDNPWSPDSPLMDRSSREEILLRKDIETVSLGYRYGCVTTTTNDLHCLGRLHPQDGANTDVFDELLESYKANDVVVGSSTACLVDQEGATHCWGSNHQNLLGERTSEYSLFPVPIRGLQKDTSTLSMGASHTCALTINGKVHCWGSNSIGQLGDGSTTDREKPVGVVGLS